MGEKNPQALLASVLPPFFISINLHFRRHPFLRMATSQRTTGAFVVTIFCGG